MIYKVDLAEYKSTYKSNHKLDKLDLAKSKQHKLAFLLFKNQIFSFITCIKSHLMVWKKQTLPLKQPQNTCLCLTHKKYTCQKMIWVIPKKLLGPLAPNVFKIVFIYRTYIETYSYLNKLYNVT